MQNKRLVMQDISKKFGGVYALKKVNFSAESGEVHALVGENGAGKSTLMKILSGAYSKDSGNIILDGDHIEIKSPKNGHDQGINVIYQEFALAPDLTVSENIFMDSFNKIIKRKEMNLKAEKFLEQIGFDEFDVTQKVSTLTTGYQQVVEICKALSKNSRVLVFDEPTAVLTTKETIRLFEIINTLKKQGVCIIYISHRLEEIFQLCDRITVLKDGEIVETLLTKDTNESNLANLMVGRNIDDLFPPKKRKIGEEVLRVQDIQYKNMVNKASFSIRKGEIVGINGLVGSGRTELLSTVFGSLKKDDGSIFVDGVEINEMNPRKAVKLGIGMLQEDRKQNGVLLNQSIRVNSTINTLQRISNQIGWISKNREKKEVVNNVQLLNVKTKSIDSEVKDLSGGNQQKVALIKWLISNCSVLILDEPTRGVDVGAKVEMYNIINTLAEEGIAVVMISSDMPEIIGMSDRVLVMRQGEIKGELHGESITEKNIIELSMGIQ